MKDIDASDSHQNCQKTESYYYWVVLICLIVSFLATIIILWRKLVIVKGKIKTDGLYLQIVTDFLWESIKIGESCVPNEQLFLSGASKSLIIEIDLVIGCRNCEAWIVWGQELRAINTTTKAEARRFVLPKYLNLTRKLARELEVEIGNVRLVRLVRQVNGLTSIIPAGTPMINGDGWSAIGAELQIISTSLTRGYRNTKGHKERKGTKRGVENPQASTSKKRDMELREQI